MLKSGTGTTLSVELWIDSLDCPNNVESKKMQEIVDTFEGWTLLHSGSLVYNRKVVIHCSERERQMYHGIHINKKWSNRCWRWSCKRLVFRIKEISEWRSKIKVTCLYAMLNWVCWWRECRWLLLHSTIRIRQNLRTQHSVVGKRLGAKVGRHERGVQKCG